MRAGMPLTGKGRPHMAQEHVRVLLQLKTLKAISGFLLGSNAVDLETLKRLGIHPDRLLKCCQDEERIPQSPLKRVHTTSSRARNTKAGAKARARRR
jgi:hypothetical protein